MYFIYVWFWPLNIVSTWKNDEIDLWYKFSYPEYL